MEPKDRACFCAMADEFYHSDAVLHAVPKENFNRTFDAVLKNSPYVKGMILEQDGQAAGYSLLLPTYSNEAGGMVLWVDELYVRPEFRQRGLAGELLRHVFSLGGKLSAVRLEVTKSNSKAIALYRRAGFTDLGYAQMLKKLGTD